MSDILLNELKSDIEKEKFLLLLQKYWKHIVVFILLLGGVFLYMDYRSSKIDRVARKQSHHLYRLEKEFKANPDLEKSVDLSRLDNKYHGLWTAYQYQILMQTRKPGEPSEIIKADAKKLIEDFFAKDQTSKTDVPDYAYQYLSLMNLLYKQENLNATDLETLIKEYARKYKPLSFFAHEVLITKFLEENNFQKAEYYIDLLKKMKLPMTYLDHRLEAYTWILDQKKPLTP